MSEENNKKIKMQDNAADGSNTKNSQNATNSATKENKAKKSKPDNKNNSASGKNTVRRKRNFKPKRLKTTSSQKPEFVQKIIEMRRVTRVVAGGRRFSFRVAVILGDRNGRVGFGIGKSTDTTFAIQKAVAEAKKNMVKLKLTEENSIPYDVEAKFKSAVVSIRPNYGKGVVAGSAARTIIEYAGVKDVTTKILSRTKNKINITRATLKALEDFIEARGEEVLKKQSAEDTSKLVLENK